MFEEAVSIAASFACTVRTQESLLDLLFVGAQAYCFTVGRGVGQTDQLLEILASVRPCTNRPFSTLESLVLRHVEQVSGCICVLLAWDEERRELVKKMRIMGIPLLVLVVTEAQAPTIEAREMGPEVFRHIPVGKAAEILAQL